MNSLKLAQPSRRLRVAQLGITVGLATLFLVVLLRASTSSAPAVASPSVAQEATALNNGSVITIGVAADLSGWFEWGGWPAANAVQLAISQTNAAGSLNLSGITYTLKGVAADSACDATQGITAANTLLNAGAVAVVGHSCSVAVSETQPLYNAAGVPMVSPAATGASLTEQGYTTTFRVIPRDDAGAVLMATYFREWLGMDEIAIVELKDFWGNGPNAFENVFTSYGGAITSRRIVTSTDDYTATLNAIQAENPDAIFYADDNPDNAGLLSNIAHDLGMSIVGWDPVLWDTPSSDATLNAYAAAAGLGAEGDYAAPLYRRIEDMPGYVTLNTAYQAASFPNHGDEATMWGAFSYDAAKIIIAAIDHADSADPVAIRDAIAATVDYDGVVGTYEGFDTKGDVIPQWAWLEQYENGQWVMLHPSKVFLPLVLNNFQ